MAAINVWRTERDRRAQAAAVLAVEADILCVIEHSPHSSDALWAAGLADRYPHVAEDAEQQTSPYFGSLVASHHPIRSKEVVDIGDRPALVTTIAVEGHDVLVAPVHTQAPIFDGDLEPWLATIDGAAALAETHPGPAVLAGDWNATGGVRAFRDALFARRLVDAQARLGQRWAPTWPQGGASARRAMLGPIPLPLPPLLALDHVVVTSDVEVLSLDRVAVPGSDHLGLCARLRLPTES